MLIGNAYFAVSRPTALPSWPSHWARNPRSSRRGDQSAKNRPRDGRAGAAPLTSLPARRARARLAAAAGRPGRLDLRKVLRVADLDATPLRRRLVAGVHREMEHEVVGQRAVPVPLAGVDDDEVARRDLHA